MMMRDVWQCGRVMFHSFGRPLGQSPKASVFARPSGQCGYFHEVLCFLLYMRWTKKSKQCFEC